ncbi:MAG: outer membrane protein assembly factor BamD [Candidatus Firestonebacteria bacterium]|nr:outer membrane protein assembly factor BamD [Candidatus Firestonebacteria bacterium]
MKKIILITVPLFIAIGVSIYAYYIFFGKDLSQEYFIEGKKSFSDNKFMQAYYNFREIVIKYPRSSYNEEARTLMRETKKIADLDRIYEKAILNYRNNNFRRAQKFFQYIIKNYPDSKYAKESIEKDEQSRKHKKIQNEFEDAELAHKDKDYASAINKYKKILSNYPDSIYTEEAKIGLSVCQNELSKISSKQAEEYNKERFDKNRQIANQIFIKANEDFAKMEYHDALRGYQKIINTYTQSEHIIEAKERAIRVMIIVNDRESRRLFFEGKELYEKGDIRKAMEKYNMIVRVYPNTEIYFRAKEELSLTQSLFGKKMFDEAKQFLDNGQKENGVNVLKKLIEKYPNTQWAEQAKFQIYLLQATGIARDLLNDANNFYSSKKYLEAAEIFEKIVRNYPDNQQLLESAKTGLIKSTAAQSFIIAEDLYLKQETQKDAIGKYNAIIRDFSNTEWAEKSISRIKDYNEGKAEEIYVVAENLFNSQKYDQSIEFYKQVISQYPAATFSNKSKANIEKTKIKMFEQKFNVVEDNYMSKDHFEEAITSYKALFTEAPDIEWKITLEKRIASAEEGIAQRLFRAAKDLYNQEKYKEATDAYALIVKKYPKNVKYIEEAQKNISIINSEIYYKKIIENLETHQYAIVARSFNQLKAEKYSGEWVKKAVSAIEPSLSGILEKAIEFLTKQYYDYALEMFTLIAENYPESDYVPKAKEGIFKVNLNKPAAAPQINIPAETK